MVNKPGRIKPPVVQHGKRFRAIIALCINDAVESMTDNNQNSKYVFISYSSQDQAFVEGLRQQLRENQVEYWVDREGIPPGASNWEHAIRKAIQGASNVIYVVTPNSFESSVVQGEIALAEMEGLTIYPVWAQGEHFIRCVPLKMGKAQYIDMRGDSYASGIEQLLEAIKQANLERAYAPPQVQPLPEGREPRNPYKGLRAFTEADARDFFGRERLVRELVAMIEERLETNSRLLAVIGPSGSGKSSVVMAGLLPTLKANAIEGSANWRYLEPFTPGSDPLTELAIALRVIHSPTYDKTLRKELAQRNGLGLVNIANDVVQEGQKLVVYIDQFEELFTLVDEETEREQFINNLVAAATLPDSPVVVLLTLRADFYDRPMNYNLLAELMQNNNRSVLPLTLGELHDAITLPAQLEDVQLDFEQELVATIAFDLLEFRVPAEKTTSLAGALPLLQFALSRLYSLREGNRLTMEAYREIGGVSGAIGTHAEEEFKRIAADETGDIAPIWTPILNRVFYFLVNIDEHGTPTRRRSSQAEITNEDTSTEKLVNLLIENRLLVTSEGGELEVAHEALLRSWSRLADWIEENGRRLQWLQKVQASAADWVKDDKPDRLLWDYEELQPVYEAVDHLKIKLDAVVQEFVRPQPERLLEEFETAPEHRQMSTIDRWHEIGADAAPALVHALTYAKGDAVTAAIDDALWEEPEAAERALIAMLTHDDPNVREATAQAIGRLGVVRAVAPLIANLTNPEFNNCVAEIEALAQISDGITDKTQVLPALMEALQQGTLDERCAAAALIGELAHHRDETAVDALLEATRDTRWELREQAALALGQTNAYKAVSQLRRLVKFDRTAYVRRAAVQALGKIGHGDAMNALIDAAVDKREEVRRASVQALTDLDADRTITMVVFRLRDEVSVVRQETAQALGKSSHPYALRPLMDALESEEYLPARVAIIEALSTYHKRDDVPPLLRRTLRNRDEMPTVRAAAARALSLMREQREASVRDLLHVLEERKLHSEIKAAIIWTLGRLHSHAAVQPLLKGLTTTRRWQTRFAAAVALSEIGDKSIADDLRKTLEEKDSDAAFAAAVVLAGLGENTERVKKELLSTLGDPRTEARCIAASALAKLRDTQTLPRLLQEMRNQNGDVRNAAADAIRAMDASSVQPQLRELLQHPFQGVRQTARKALNG